MNCKENEPQPITNLGGKQKLELEPPTEKSGLRNVFAPFTFCVWPKQHPAHNYESFALKINRMENLIPTVALGRAVLGALK